MEQDTNQEVSTNKSVGKGGNMGVVIAIIFAGALIAGALYFASNPKEANAPTPKENAKPTGSIPAVSAEDHILGNPNAQVFIVEYSDFECPFCKNFHNTMKRIIDEYGKDGRIAWVYRHFPLAQLHSKAQEEAEASECAAELGGNDGFWNFANRIFEVTPSNNLLDLAQLPVIAEEIGLDRTAFEECLSSGRHTAKVEQQFNDVIAGGGTGTPYSVILVGNESIPIEGAQPYEVVKTMVETTLNSLN
jgi:protein-disulfide isomerase